MNFGFTEEQELLFSRFFRSSLAVADEVRPDAAQMVARLRWTWSDATSACPGG